jgi:Ser/Thr protein kinase RdoA (MazF antagonist)
VATGVNNSSFLVVTATGEYILNSYLDVMSREQLEFEHALLTALNAAGLPFAVPAPIPASSGDTIVTIDQRSQVQHWSLTRRIPGRAAERDNVSDAAVSGEALASLHRALGTIALDPAIDVPGTFGVLADVHPAVLDPVDAIERLHGVEVAMVTAGAMARWCEQTRGWPTQMIHADCYPTNVLVSADAVSGVLDFEYAGRGHLAMDVAIGLAAFSTKSRDGDWAWPVFDAFARGYLRQSPLDPEELDAIPTLILAREATSLVHWLGRHAQGLTDDADIGDRARRLLTVDAWLDAHGDRLIGQLRDVNGW